MTKNKRRDVWANLTAVFAVLFLFSPVFNFYFAFYFGGYINFTSIFLLSFVVISFWEGFSFKKKEIIVFVIGAFFVCYAGFAVTYSPSQEYPKSKFFFLFCHYLFFLFLAFKRREVIGDYIEKYMCLAAFISAVLFVVNSSVILGAQDRSRDLNDGLNASIYLMTGFLIGLTSLFFLIFSSRSYGVRTLFLTISSIFILYTGSRGPLIFLLICSFFYFFIAAIKGFFGSVSKKKIISGMFFSLFFVAGGVALLFFSDFFEVDEFSRAFARIYKLSDLSSTGRIKHLDFVINAEYSANQIFLGRGLGSYGYYFYGVDAREYPHNIFLEIGFELGLIGVLFFLLFVISIFNSLNYNYINAFIFILYPILELMKSSSFSDFRPFWFSCAVAMIFMGRGKIS